MSISDAVITAQAMVAKFGPEVVSAMDQLALGYDAEAAIFWRRVAIAARLLPPRSSSLAALIVSAGSSEKLLP